MILHKRLSVTMLLLSVPSDRSILSVIHSLYQIYGGLLRIESDCCMNLCFSSEIYFFPPVVSRKYFKLECLQEGQWEETTCEPISCPAPPDVFQGMYTCTNSLYYDTVCTLQCPDATENVRFWIAGPLFKYFQPIDVTHWFAGFEVLIGPSQRGFLEPVSRGYRMVSITR